MLLKINTGELNRFITERINDILETLKEKGKVYTGDENKFKNFNEASNILQCEPEQALVGFMIKHVVWLLDYVKQLQSYTTPTKKEEQEINEKIGDIINYLLILNAMLHERTKVRKKIELHQLTKRIVAINNEDEQDEIKRLEERQNG